MEQQEILPFAAGLSVGIVFGFLIVILIIKMSKE